MRRIFVVGASLVAIAFIVQCSSFTSSETSGNDAGGVGRDASSSDVDNAVPLAEAGPADDVAAPIADAGADAYADCTVIFEDAFAVPGLGAAWQTRAMRADASIPVANGIARLLADGEGSAAAVMWHHLDNVPTGSALVVDVTVDISPVDDSDTIADGVAIAWAPETPTGMTADDFITLGNVGTSLGLCGGGPIGAIGFGLFTSPTDPGNGLSARHVGVLTVGDNACPQLSSTFTLAPTMALNLRINGTNLKVTGANTATTGDVFTQTLEHTTDIAWLGFGAGSGSHSSNQGISQLRVHACPSTH